MAQSATRNRSTTGDAGPRTTDPAGTRSRTHVWEPPRAYAAAGEHRGLELARMSLDGLLPEAPICGTLGFRLVEVEQGRAVFEGDPGEHLFNPMGTVHGGFMATLLDSALGTAVLTALPAGRGYTTIQLAVNMIRPVFATTPTLRCAGTTVHVGRSTATAEARIVGAADGRLYAHGTTTCAVFALPSGA
ncbi:PaaI family thioesterase [Streptomyces sp. NPDC048514]|uniref:PaaI family thioesterase n=1 Tax=Streptomyces sp. NPDC048514 TaxID=3365564 RepID=UPI00371FC56C